MANHKSRPLLVTLIALLYLILGIIVLVGAIGVMTGSMVLDDPDLAVLGGGGLLVMGLIMIVLFLGFWKGWSIFWYIGVIFTVIALIVDVAGIITVGIGAILPLVIEAIILLYLFKDNVKGFFLD